MSDSDEEILRMAIELEEGMITEAGEPLQDSSGFEFPENGIDSVELAIIY